MCERQVETGNDGRDVRAFMRALLNDLAPCVMDWRHVHHVAIKDDEGRLVGIITAKDFFDDAGRLFEGRLSATYSADQPLEMNEAAPAEVSERPRALRPYNRVAAM